MILLYWTISVINLAYLIFKKRNIDLFTIGFLSLIYYTLPAFFGTISLGKHIVNMQIHNKVYYFLIFLQLLFLIVIVFNDKRINNKELKEKGNKQVSKYYIFCIFFLTILFYCIEFLISGFDTFFSLDKAEIRMTTFYGLGIWGALMSFFLGIKYKYNYIIIGSLIFILFSLFVGSRAYIATAILGCILLLSKNKIRLVNSWRNILVLIISFLFLVFYKTIYTAVKTLDSDILTNSIKNINFSELPFFSESNAILSNLNVILLYEIKNEYSVLEYSLHQIPFSSLFLTDKYVTFSRFVSANVHPDIHFGMGGNLWGEIYSVFGFVGMYIAAILWVLLIYITNISLYKFRGTILILPAIIYVVFYVHRIDLSFVIGSFQSNIFIIFLAFLFYSIYIKQFIRYKVMDYTLVK
ncbi:O-antigen polymerase [Virgibacillus halodenitrificans]|uniref:O-antigen polymerase n=1 Tax=Virgibacillus halodenitrificans TaxID=1482 RepID=UPI001F46B9BB|nr:O-antigen polymerase [Virgibacillus halodenitrificans]